MNEELNELIIYYEEEKSRLEELLAECLQFSDYKYASQFQRGLRIVNTKLNILKYFEDPNYLKRKKFSDQIEHYHKVKLINPLISAYIDERIKRDEKNLDQLTTIKIQPFYDGQEFDESIFDLVEKRIKGFNFHLKKKANLYLNFSIKNNYLRIKLTPFSNLGDYFSIGKSEMINLKQIGFRKNKSQKYLRYKYPLMQFKDSIFIKTIVSRVIYEVFFYHDLDKVTTLEIKG